MGRHPPTKEEEQPPEQDPQWILEMTDDASCGDDDTTREKEDEIKSTVAGVATSTKPITTTTTTKAPNVEGPKSVTNSTATKNEVEEGKVKSSLTPERTPSSLIRLEQRMMKGGDESTATLATSTPPLSLPAPVPNPVHPGAFHVAGIGTAAEDEGDTIGSPSEGIEEGIRHHEDGTTPLDANVVEEGDFEKAVQQRIKDRTVMALSVVPRQNDRNSTKHQQSTSNKKLYTGFLFLMGIFCLAVALGVLLPSKTRGQDADDDSEDHDNVIIITIQPNQTEPPMLAPPVVSNSDWMREWSGSISGGDEVFLDPMSPQSQALDWIIQEDPIFASLFDNMTQSFWIERYVIAVLYFATGGPNWYSSLRFLTGNHTCNWNSIEEQLGLNCELPSRSVKSIVLDANNLNGTIPSELSALTALEDLSLFGGGGFLHGTLPPSLGNLTRLTFFQLSLNSITGPIPSTYSNLRKLKFLFLPGNILTGTIPNFLFEMPSMNLLHLSYNSFTGTIPNVVSPSMIDDSDMQQLWLAHNMLTGSIPESIYSLPLQALWLEVNRLTGSLSNRVGDLDGLVELWVDTNNMDGTLPSYLGDLSNLQYLSVYSNGFSGTLPSELGRLSRLGVLRAEENQFSGQIPLELAELPLIELYLQFNNLTGNLGPFCNQSISSLDLRTDCAGETPAVDCPCCTTCCDRTLGEDFGECTVDLAGLCENLDVEDWFLGVSDTDEQDREDCDCSVSEEQTAVLSCRADQCQSCNLDGTVCSINQDYGMTFDRWGSVTRSYSTLQYVVGRNDTVRIETEKDTNCQVFVNGEMCNMCTQRTCPSGFFGYEVSCDNVVGVGRIDLCSDDHDVVGPLAVFAFQDTLFLMGCPPVFPLFKFS